MRHPAEQKPDFPSVCEAVRSNQEVLQHFYEVLSMPFLADLRKLLSDPTANLTVFAPLDDVSLRVLGPGSWGWMPRTVVLCLPPLGV